MSLDRLWYASYGSNMAIDRLTCYLAGGCPPGATRTYPGARDPSPPLDLRPVSLPGSVYFAWTSPTWGGGIAFYDPEAPGTSYGRAYLMTLSQLSDVAAQEMHRPPGTDLDLTDVLSDGVSVIGPGRYESLHAVGSLDSLPVVTFTAGGVRGFPAPTLSWEVQDAGNMLVTTGGNVNPFVWNTTPGTLAGTYTATATATNTAGTDSATSPVLTLNMVGNVPASGTFAATGEHGPRVDRVAAEVGVTPLADRSEAFKH